MITLVGGFATGRRTLERTARRLAAKFDTPVTPFTYSWCVRNPEVFKSELNERSKVVAISAGNIALANSGVRVDQLDAYGSPLPSSRLRMFGNTIMKTANMLLRPGNGNRSRRETLTYLASSLTELVIHPVSNLRSFVDGSISRFNSTDELSQAAASTRLIYGSSDEYYGDIAAGLGNRVELIDGARHDDIVLGGQIDDRLAA